MLDIEIIRKAIKSYGAPLYIFDEKHFVENYSALIQSMKAEYPRYRLSYSYKTNYTPYICALVKRLGGYAEVVSDMEYLLAKRLGYNESEIVYNGPAKGAQLERHVLSGGINNVDNASECRRICAVARDNPETEIKIGLRLNIDLGRGGISRFGMREDAPEFKSMLESLKECDNVRIVGLHCHLSHARDLQAWEKRADLMLAAADRLIDGVPEYLSLGSGMFGKMDDKLAKTFSGHIPTYDEYAAVTARKVAAHYNGVEEDKKPLLFSEPGTTLISSYIDFAANVLDIKSVGDKCFAVTDGSFYNLGEISRKRNLPIRHVPCGAEGEDICADIVGYTCLEYDVMYRNYCGALSVGDNIVFGNVGGYSVVSKPQFIRENCHMVAAKEDGELALIMRGETFADVFDKFVF